MISGFVEDYQRNCSNRRSFADSKPRQRQRQQEQQQPPPVRIFKQLVRLVHPTQHPPAPPAPPPPPWPFSTTATLPEVAR